MYRRFHDRFGTAGLVVAVIALIAALAGTAIAAGGLTGKQKKEVTKIAKKYAGKPGATGATGPAGPAGANGTNGKDGTNGTNGANGKSVLANEIPGEPGEECEEVGGTEFEVEGSGTQTYACNGKEGSPWTAGGTLPSKATETGMWRFASAESPKFFGAFFLRPISFPIPLKAALDAAHVKFVSGTVPAECENPEHAGTASVLNPEADPGYLCVFKSAFEEGTPAIGILSIKEFAAGADTTGAMLFSETASFYVIGSFAVTGAP